MSVTDTVPLLGMPWLSRGGIRLSTTPLPGLQSEVIQELESSYPGVLSPEMRQLLQTSCGLEGTALGSLDFTGRWHPEEPLSIFRPCLTLAIDDAGRRWIAETASGAGLPGPVWCVLAQPEVALRVAHDLGDFLATLHEYAQTNGTVQWLRGLLSEARAIWNRRHTLAIRAAPAHRGDREIRGWFAALPPDAYVYDLRRTGFLRGWPYGLAGPSGHYFRCGNLPVFAVAGWPKSGAKATVLIEESTAWPPAAPIRAINNEGIVAASCISGAVGSNTGDIAPSNAARAKAERPCAAQAVGLNSKSR